MHFDYTLILINPKAGTASFVFEDSLLKQIFTSFSTLVNIVRTKHIDHMKQAINALPKSAPILLVVAGGDGTLHAVVNTMNLSRMTLAVLPCGTMNHFAKSIHMKMDIQQCISEFKHSQHSTVVPIDIGSVNNYFFLNHANIGLHPSFIHHRDHVSYKGWKKWYASTRAFLHTWQYPSKEKLTITIQHDTYSLSTAYVFISVNTFYLRRAQPYRSKLTEGVLTLYTGTTSSRKDILRVYTHILSGQTSLPVGLITHRTPLPITITSEKKHIAVSMDGERVILPSPLTFSIRPKALKLLLPKS